MTHGWQEADLLHRVSFFVMDQGKGQHSPHHTFRGEHGGEEIAERIGNQRPASVRTGEPPDGLKGMGMVAKDNVYPKGGKKSGRLPLGGGGLSRALLTPMDGNDHEIRRLPCRRHLPADGILLPTADAGLCIGRLREAVRKEGIAEEGDPQAVLLKDGHGRFSFRRGADGVHSFFPEEAYRIRQSAKVAARIHIQGVIVGYVDYVKANGG